MFKKLCPLIFLFAPAAFGQSYAPYRLDPLLPNTAIRICQFPEVNNPCSNTVQEYADSAGATPLANPLSIGPSGQMTFYLPIGSYVLQMTGQNTGQKVIEVLNTALSGATGGGGGGSTPCTSAGVGGIQFWASGTAFACDPNFVFDNSSSQDIIDLGNFSGTMGGVLELGYDNSEAGQIVMYNTNGVPVYFAPSGSSTGVTSFGLPPLSGTQTIPAYRVAPTNGDCAKWDATNGANGLLADAGAPCSSGGGDTITSPHSTLAVGGTATNTTLDLQGAAGKIMAGVTPALTFTPTLGVSGTPGTLSFFPASGNFTTTLGSAAAASNTVDFFASVPANLDLFYCTVSSTTCTFTDTGYAYNAIPNADLAHSSITINTTSPLGGGGAFTLGSTNTITCSTCATTTNGGALSATSPVTINAAGVIACATCNTSAAIANPPFDKSATGLSNPTADATFTQPAASVSGWSLAGTAPAPVATTPGTNGSSLLNVTAPAGGASSNAAGVGGVGGSPAMTAGVGGAGTGTNATGGSGGAVTLTTGAGGASAGTGANANGGNLAITLGIAGTGGSGTAGLAGIVNINGPTAGFWGCTQGTAPTTANTNIPANSRYEYCPASVTAYGIVHAGAAATGLPHYSNSSSLITETISEVNLASADVTGILPVANGGTNLASGTSGGVLCYTATGTLASSSLLATNALVVGGGAGVCPTTGNGDFTYATHTLTGGASGLVNLSAEATGGFITPVAAGATSASNGSIDYDTTGNSTHVRTDAADSNAVGVVATSDTSNSAAISATTIYTPTTTRGFRISMYAIITTAATTSSILGGTTGYVLTYTDGTNSVAQTMQVPLVNTSGTLNVTGTGQTGNTTTTLLTGSAYIKAKTGVAIKHAFGYTSVGGTAMVYQLTVKVEAL